MELRSLKAEKAALESRSPMHNNDDKSPKQIRRRRSFRSTSSRTNLEETDVGMVAAGKLCDYSNMPLATCGCQNAQVVDLQYKIQALRDFDMAQSTYRCTFELYAWWKDDEMICEVKHLSAKLRRLKRLKQAGSQEVSSKAVKEIEDEIETVYDQGWNPDLRILNACDDTSVPLRSRKRILDIKANKEPAPPPPPSPANSETSPPTETETETDTEIAVTTEPSLAFPELLVAAAALGSFPTCVIEPVYMYTYAYIPRPEKKNTYFIAQSCTY